MSNIAVAEVKPDRKIILCEGASFDPVDLFNALSDGMTFGEKRDKKNDFNATVLGLCFTTVISENDFGESKEEPIVYLLTKEGGLVSKSKVVIQKMQLLVESGLLDKGPAKLSFNLKKSVDNKYINTIRAVK